MVNWLWTNGTVDAILADGGATLAHPWPGRVDHKCEPTAGVRPTDTEGGGCRDARHHLHLPRLGPAPPIRDGRDGRRVRWHTARARDRRLRCAGRGRRVGERVAQRVARLDLERDPHARHLGHTEEAVPGASLQLTAAPGAM